MNDVVPDARGQPRRRSLTAFAWLSVGAAVTTITLKTAAWAMTGSVGLLSDAAESVVNLVAAVVAVIALTVAARPPDESHHFGHTKAEYFSAGLEAIMIFLAALVIVAAAADRFIHPRALENVGAGLLVSGVAAAINGGVALVLLRAGRRHRSITLTADGKHLMTDVWTSGGVIAAVFAVALTGWERLDPLIAIAVGLNIIVTGSRLLVRAVDGLMDHAVSDEQHRRIVAVLTGIGSDAVGMHALRTRESGNLLFVSAHVTVPAQWTVQRGHDLLEEIEQALHTEFDPVEVLLHLEPAEQPCVEEKRAGQFPVPTPPR